MVVVECGFRLCAVFGEVAARLLSFFDLRGPAADM
jgi:hypothetical protein